MMSVIFGHGFHFQQNVGKLYSQGAERRKVHVYLPYRGAISFNVFIFLFVHAC